MSNIDDGCDDTSCELLVSPMPTPSVQPLHVNRRARRRRVLFVDSRKPNSIAILRRAQALLRARGVEVSDIELRPDPGMPMSDQLLDRLKQEDGVLLFGVSD